ncbi:hypothetical protein [Nonomuraea turkmeniaca]|uniref:hypothetical protein n=1 Tax=Nonomuraea turkmeniaca TaxID=103838 RepID=UPI00110ADC4A|nr:hypothetical protein [Nonomuraea turkmeniaca]
MGRLLDHQQQTESKHACLHDADPWARSADCPLRQEVADLHAEIATRGDMIVLDAATPIPGFASAKVPGGEVGIDLGTREVVLIQHVDGIPRRIRWIWEDALVAGEVLMTAAIAARNQPDPAQVEKLAVMMHDFGDSDLVALARHLIASGVQLPDAS